VSTQAEIDRSGLTAWLEGLWATPVDVTIDGYSTAGARRRNVLFDVVSAYRSGRFVATILPTAEIAILSMEDEAAVRSLAHAHGVPVPVVIGVCRDASVVGGAFFVSECVEGETIPRRVLRLVEREASGDNVVRQIGAAIAKLHAIDAELAPAALTRKENAVAGALAEVTQAVDGMLQPEPAFSYGLRWLREHQPPEPDRQVVVHADVRTGNIIVGVDGLRAILDWETSKIGDPMEDLAWVCTRMWRFGRDDLTVGGLGSLRALRRSYESTGGHWDDRRFRWWRVLTTLRWGTGLAGQAAAHLDGTFSSVVMAASGRRVSEIAYDVLTLVRGATVPEDDNDVNLV
jgi:aminoglycoside phosphotransferase (APT) family kinase protein